MTTVPNYLRKAARNKIFQYVFSRYITYFIQFINSLFIAVYLGPYYLGVWGFITLVLRYMDQVNLGISHSVNAITSIYKTKEWYIEKVVGTSFTMLLCLSVLFGLFFLLSELFGLRIGEKYSFHQYSLVVFLIGIMGYFNTLFSGVFRVHGRITEVAISQSAFPIMMLIAILFFKGEHLIWALVWANFVAFMVSLIIFLVRNPVNLRPLFIRRLAVSIQARGWHLFLYNSSFYFIIISTRSFISGYYSVKEFGYFTFAFALANVVLLLLQSFSFIIFPKIINRLASAANEKVIQLLRMVRDTYITTAHLLVHFAILLFPMFLLFFPQYESSASTFNLVALTMVLYTNSFGYSGLLIAKQEERKLGLLALFAFFLNSICALVLIKIFHVAFEYVIIASMITYFFYVFFIARMCRDRLKLKTSVISVLQDIYPIRLILPYLLSLSLIAFSFSEVFYILPVLTMILFNYKVLKEVRLVVRNILFNPTVLDI